MSNSAQRHGSLRRLAASSCLFKGAAKKPVRHSILGDAAATKGVKWNINQTECHHQAGRQLETVAIHGNLMKGIMWSTAQLGMEPAASPVLRVANLRT